MSTSKYLNAICCISMIFALAICILFMNGQSLGLKIYTDPDSEQHSDDAYFTENDLDGNWDTSRATKIVLNGDKHTIEGNGAYQEQNKLVIAKDGKYSISGNIKNGSIVVDADKTSKVWILLNNASINCDDDACIKVAQADKVFLTLEDGTTNSISQGSSLNSSAKEDNVDGAIFAHDDLTINGSGKLNISTELKGGIAANDDLVIAGGELNIDAKSNGITANDSVRLTKASITVKCGGKGILSDNEDSYLYIASGTINVNSADDAMHSNSNITIDGGNMNISSDDDGIHGNNSVVVNGGTIKIDRCYEGIEGNSVTINDGDITIYPSDDGINASNGESNEPGNGQQGGMVPQGSTDSDAISNNPPSPPSSGSNDLHEPPNQGRESHEPPTKPDDTIDNKNADTRPQGPEKSGEFGKGENTNDVPRNFGQLDSTGNSSNSSITINGGKVTIINENGRDADGIDSNGSITINAGEILISMNGDAGSYALDYDTKCAVNGGNIVACGSNGMLELPTTNSTQGYISYNANVQDNSSIELIDDNGNGMLKKSAPLQFTNIIISCNNMQKGSNYTLVINDGKIEVETS